MKLEFNFLERIKTENNYSDNDIKKIQYVLEAFLSDISKLLIMGILFYHLHYFPEYLGAVTVLMFIRTNSGGLHFKHYLTCLIFSFLLIFCSVVILPKLIIIDRLFMTAGLIGCICIIFLLEPVRCIYRPVPGKDLIRLCHINTFKYIFLFLVISYVLPPNPIITCGFWTVTLQILQLIIANILKKGGLIHEKNN